MSDHFSNLADTWWDKNGPVKTLHAINVPRLKFIQQHCKLQETPALDLGCGAGILSESLAIHGATVTAVDVSKELISVAQQHCDNNKLDITYIADAVETYVADSRNHDKFAVLTCMELLEHVQNPRELVLHCAKLLKPNGKLFFSTLNRNIKSYLMAIIGAEYILNLVPRGTHEHEKFIKPSELNSWLTTADLKLNAISGISYNPVNNMATLHNNVSVNYIIYATKK